jgi:hypothetical protein
LCRRLAHHFLAHQPVKKHLESYFVPGFQVTWRYDDQAEGAQSAQNLGLLGELNDRILKAEELQVNINKALRGETSLEEAKGMLADMEVWFHACDSS